MFTEPLPDFLKNLYDLGITVYDPMLPGYKYTSLGTAEKILQNLNVRFRTPSSFNDPLEFSKDMFDYSCTVKVFKEKLIRGMEMKYNRPLTKQEKQRLFLKYTVDNYKTAYRQVIESSRQLSLVFCMSKEYDNPLMWSHYAQSHTGIVLGIKFGPLGDFTNGESLMALCVTYVEEMTQRPIFTLLEDEKSKAFFSWIFTKSINWQYEKEIRCFIDNSRGAFPLKEEGITPYSTGKYCDILLNEEQFCEYIMVSILQFQKWKN